MKILTAKKLEKADFSKKCEYMVRIITGEMKYMECLRTKELLVKSLRSCQPQLYKTCG